MLDPRRRMAAPRAVLTAALALACTLPFAAAARADATGELLAFGAPGFGASQFVLGGPVAVDPSDADSIYVADTADDTVRPRIRKFAVAGGPALATLLPPRDNADGTVNYVAGIAVDPGSDRLYVLMGGFTPDGQAVDVQLLAYSTVPAGGKLVAAAGLASPVLADFRTGAAAPATVGYPTGIAVDVASHDVVIAGVDDPTTSIDPVLQTVSATGAPGSRVKVAVPSTPDGPLTGSPAGVAAGPDGSVYFPAPYTDGTLDSLPGVKIWRLARGASTPVEVALVPSASEGGPNIPAGAQPGIGYGGPIAVSPDGATVYLTGASAVDTSGWVRGYSTASGAAVVSYGGGTTSCFLPNRYNQLGVAAGADGRLVVMSPGDIAGESSDRAVHVFGPGGSGCPAPTGSFTVGGKADAAVTVTKGATVTFDASGSALNGATPTEVAWDFDGSGAFATRVIGSPAALTTTYRFLKSGTFSVGMRVVAAGVPSAAVTRTVTVVAPPPTAAFTVSNRTPSAGAAVSFDAGASTDPTGSPEGGPTNVLAKYRWDFGDGQTAEATTSTISHTFANAASTPAGRIVRLTVVNADGVASTPAAQTLTVGASAGGTPPAPPAPPAPPTPPGQTPITPAPGTAVTPTVTTPTPTTPVPPGGPNSAPSTNVLRPRLTPTSIDAKGVLRLKISCPKGVGSCTGTIALTTKQTRTVKGKKRVTSVKLGTVRFTVVAGKSTTAKVKLSTKGRSLLRKSRRLTVGAALKLTAGTATATAKATFTIKAPKAKKKS